jgi:thioredoxin-like negative regulator of GroEL
VVNLALAHLYVFRGEDERAIQQLRHTIALDPTFDEARINLALMYARLGQPRQAAAVLPQMPQARPDREVYSHLLAGQPTEALAALDRLEQLSRFRYVSAVDLASFNLLLGRKQQALDWLEQGFRDRSTEMMFLKVSPVFDPLRPEPRFQELLRKMSLN